MSKNKISIESYKGVRDFYPEDQDIQNYIFGVMKSVAQSFGYLEYSASILEPLELYKAKSSEEIVDDQIYSFTDRGDREVALRPEMTPTVARMIAAKVQELLAPIRWYSIPNVFRYEKPQRGRLREHFQLNVDLFGVVGPFADAEAIFVAYQIMEKFGAKSEDFEIKINSRGLLDDILKKIDVDSDKKQFVYRLLDKKDKMEDDKFRHALTTLIGEEKSKNLLEILYFGEGILSMMSDPSTGSGQAAKYLSNVLDILRGWGVSNIVFDTTVTRGFDYYTGVVFEVYDTNKENNRSLFGGGRYDDLTNNFINQSVPAFGFGMGDVTIRDFLLTHNLMPKIPSTVQLLICIAPETDVNEVYKIAFQFRQNNINTAIDIAGKKLVDQLKNLDKRNVPFVLTIGPDELTKKVFTLRNTQTREEKSGNIEEISSFIHSNS